MDSQKNLRDAFKNVIRQYLGELSCNLRHCLGTLPLYNFGTASSSASIIAVSYSSDRSECFGMSWEAIPIETKATAGRRKDSGRRLGRKKERKGGRRKNVELGRRKEERKDRGGGGRKEGERENTTVSLYRRGLVPFTG